MTKEQLENLVKSHCLLTYDEAKGLHDEFKNEFISHNNENAHNAMNKIYHFLRALDKQKQT